MVCYCKLFKKKKQKKKQKYKAMIDPLYLGLWGFQEDIFEPTCAFARWALMHRFLYVCV